MTRSLTRRGFNKATAGVAGVTMASGLYAPAVIGAAKAKVVVIGGGAGGATVARYTAKGSEDLEVTLINDSPTYTTCFFSNLFIGGFRSFDSITHSYDTLKSAHGINIVTDRAVGIDLDKRSVALAGGGAVPYDKVVVAPGIGFKYDAIEGYGPKIAGQMPHAWQAGEQTQILKRQLSEMEDGGTFVICSPPNPFRCPPGPYERVSMVAHYFKQNKPKSKIVILDAKNKFSKQKLFEDAWARFYPGMVEWVPGDIIGSVSAVKPASMEIVTDDETMKADVANVIPPQRAGDIAIDAGLANDSGWCEVDPATLASKVAPHVHLVGDAIVPGDMPKSGFSANSQAKVCAQSVLVELAGKKAFPARFRNTCWSLLATDNGVKVGANYEATAEKISKTEGFISKADEADDVRAATAEEANGWYAAITKDIFG